MKSNSVKKMFTYMLTFMVLFMVSGSVKGACSDYRATQKDDCNSAVEDGYKCKYNQRMGGCYKTNEKAVVETPTPTQTPAETPAETPATTTQTNTSETGKCQTYNAKGQATCESHSEDGYACEYHIDQKGFQCRKGKTLTSEAQKSKKEEYTSCEDIGNDKDTCTHSMIKGPNDEEAVQCVYRQGWCYGNRVVETGYDETIIASTEKQEQEEKEKLNDGKRETTKSSTWNSSDGNTNKFLKTIWDMLKIIIPMLVIIFSIVDFLKVLFISDEKNYKEAYTRLITRIAIGIILFLLPAILSLLLDLAGLQDVGIFEIFS